MTRSGKIGPSVQDFVYRWTPLLALTATVWAGLIPVGSLFLSMCLTGGMIYGAVIKAYADVGFEPPDVDIFILVHRSLD